MLIGLMLVVLLFIVFMLLCGDLYFLLQVLQLTEIMLNLIQMLKRTYQRLQNYLLMLKNFTPQIIHLNNQKDLAVLFNLKR
jgi:hypothetical protein